MAPTLLLFLLILVHALPAQVAVQKGSSAVGEAVVGSVERFMAEGIRRLKDDFPGTPKRAMRVIVHQNVDSMPADVRQHLTPRSPGLALLGRDEIHIVLAHLKYNPPGDLRTVVVHELVHLLLDQYVGPEAGSYVPRWFHEGLAQVLSEGLYLGIREEDIVWRVRHHTYLSFSELADDFPHDDQDSLRLAYGQSFSYVSFLRDQVGLQTLLKVARGCGRHRDFGRAFLEITGQTLAVQEQNWTNHVVHGSGAPCGFLLRNYFLILLAAALPLLVFAVIRRLRRDEIYRKKLALEDENDYQADQGHVRESDRWGREG